MVSGCSRGGLGTARLIKHCNGLHRDVVESPALQMSKESLDTALSATVMLLHLHHRLDSMISGVFSNLTDPVEI